MLKDRPHRSSTKITPTFRHPKAVHIGGSESVTNVLEGIVREKKGWSILLPSSGLTLQNETSGIAKRLAMVETAAETAERAGPTRAPMLLDPEFHSSTCCIATTGSPCVSLYVQVTLASKAMLASAGASVPFLELTSWMAMCIEAGTWRSAEAPFHESRPRRSSHWGTHSRRPVCHREPGSQPSEAHVSNCEARTAATRSRPPPCPIRPWRSP
mmetsp:Transcript_26395/g.61175  ORF Transcript_26395/g.61175 Transcript_26395/m.61175 type:complete len:213 (-) Transcript_26395:187-825(-)